MARHEFNTNWHVECQYFTKDVTLPHDAMLESGRDQTCDSGSAGAFFRGDVYSYTKKFNVTKDLLEKHLTFEFEGVYKNAKVYLNNKEIGGAAYGYIPFFCVADAVLIEGENILRVVADNKDIPNSRWYSGAGIYRPVWMHVQNKKCIQLEGVHISTLSYSPAIINVKTKHNGGELKVEIYDEEKKVATAHGENVDIEIPCAKLWSDEGPNLYTCKVTLSEDGIVLDEVCEAFGIRMIEWSNKGLFINGKETKLRGGCVHHDNGILGGATYAKSEERRVRILKETGYNAIRSSHNPASKAMLEACDRLGMYVMDETWDTWFNHKNKFDYGIDFENNYKYDLAALVNRDYNHPSVIMYSIGNEVGEPAKEKGVKLTKEMTAILHDLDKTRPVTAGINLMIIKMVSKGKGIYKEEGGMASQKEPKANSSLLFNMMTSMVGTSMNKMANSKQADAVTSPCLDSLDIAGYNYASGRYPLEGKAHPNRIVVGSETFPQDIAKNWAMVKKYPYLIGDFMWTSWDYLGEAGIGAWSYHKDGAGFHKPYPWLLADVGAIDILGNLGAEAEYAATVWGLRKKPYIGVQPVNQKKTPYKGVWRGTNAFGSWSWLNCDGNKAIVEIYADAESVELIRNGKRLGSQKIKDFKAVFKTKYESGKLEAITYDGNGKELSRNELNSAKGKINIKVIPEENTVKCGNIVYLTVSLVGDNGIVESNADTKLKITVENGELLAFGSANPRTEEDYLSGSFTTYYGRAQAIVRTKSEGLLGVTVTGNSMKAEASVIVSK